MLGVSPVPCLSSDLDFVTRNLEFQTLNLKHSSNDAELRFELFLQFSYNVHSALQGAILGSITDSCRKSLSELKMTPKNCPGPAILTAGGLEFGYLFGNWSGEILGWRILTRKPPKARRNLS